MKRKSYADMNCSVARALDVVGDPWTLLVVRDLFWNFHRFDEIQQRLGIARNTLTDRLSLLVDHGVAKRVKYQDSPARYEYRLTEKGRALRPVIWSLMEWGDTWSGIEQPPVRLVDGESGRVITPLLVDAETRTPLRDLDVRAIHVDDTSAAPGRASTH